MKKETGDTGVVNVDTVEKQNGHSDSDDWKKALEREKLELEIEKIRADQEKATLEIKDLKRPPFFRAAFITVLGPAVLSLFAAGMAIYFGAYSQQMAQLHNANAELANKESAITEKESAITDKNKEIENLNTEIERKTTEVKQLAAKAEQQLSELNQRIADFQANTEKEKREKEAFQNANKNLQTQKTTLEGQLASLNSQKEKDEATVADLRFEYTRLNDQIDEANERVKTVRLEGPFEQLMSHSAREDVSTTSAFHIGRDEIYKVFDRYPQFRNEHENYFRNAIEKNLSIRQKLRISGLLYSLIKSDEWRIKFEELLKIAIPSAVIDIKNETTDYEPNFRHIFVDIRVIGQNILAPVVFDVLRHDIGTLYSSPEKVELIFSIVNLNHLRTDGFFLLGNIRKNPIFYRFLDAGRDIAFSRGSESRQKRGLDFVMKLAGVNARDIFIFELISKGRISSEAAEEVLKAAHRPGRPKNLLELKKWASENKCLYDFWIDPDLTYPKTARSVFDSVLLEKRIKGECN